VKSSCCVLRGWGHWGLRVGGVGGWGVVAVGVGQTGVARKVVVVHGRGVWGSKKVQEGVKGRGWMVRVHTWAGALCECGLTLGGGSGWEVRGG
jgi:hypothetical protein